MTMTREEFKAKVSMALGSMERETWEDFLEAVWQLHLEASNQWIPVEEKLPKEKQKVLVYMPADERCNHEYMCEALYNYAWHKWEDADEPIELEGITHWMLLPQLPRKEE